LPYYRKCTLLLQPPEQQDLAIKTIKNTFEANKPSSAKLLLSGASIVAVEMGRVSGKSS
jgi:hypothetical protein